MTPDETRIQIIKVILGVLALGLLLIYGTVIVNLLTNIAHNSELSTLCAR